MSSRKKLICVIAAFTVFMSLSSCEMPMKIVGSIPDPKNTVIGFFDSVCAGDFASSDKYLSGVSLSMKKQVEGEFAGKLYDYLISSYDYKLNGEVTSDLLDASCKVDFTYLDLNLMSEDLKTTATKLGEKYVTEAKEGYVEEGKDGSAPCLEDHGSDGYRARRGLSGGNVFHPERREHDRLPCHERPAGYAGAGLLRGTGRKNLLSG